MSMSLELYQDILLGVFVPSFTWNIFLFLFFIIFLLSICCSALDKTTASPNHEGMALYMIGLCVDCMCCVVWAGQFEPSLAHLVPGVLWVSGWLGCSRSSLQWPRKPCGWLKASDKAWTRLLSKLSRQRGIQQGCSQLLTIPHPFGRYLGAN